MIIDCDSCVVRNQACEDCVISVLLGVPEVPGSGEERHREPAGPGDPLPVEFGPVERRALEVLADHGMIPRLRLLPATADTPVARGSGPQWRRDVG